MATANKIQIEYVKAEASELLLNMKRAVEKDGFGEKDGMTNEVIMLQILLNTMMMVIDLIGRQGGVRFMEASIRCVPLISSIYSYYMAKDQQAHERKK